MEKNSGEIRVKEKAAGPEKYSMEKLRSDKPGNPWYNEPVRPVNGGQEKAFASLIAQVIGLLLIQYLGGRLL